MEGKKSSIVTKVELVSTFPINYKNTGELKDMYKFEIEFENGDIGMYYSLQENNYKFVEGENAEYYIVETETETKIKAVYANVVSKVNHEKQLIRAQLLNVAYNIICKTVKSQKNIEEKIIRKMYQLEEVISEDNPYFNQ